MKKGGILNPAICSLLAELGQSDELLIVDAAYPLPTDGHVIDLTLTPGIPRLLDVLRAVTEELVVDAIAVPAEIKEYSPRIYQEILKIVGDTDVDEVPFHEFKEQALDVKGIIRSAEFSPYASVRIVAGSAVLSRAGTGRPGGSRPFPADSQRAAAEEPRGRQETSIFRECEQRVEVGVDRGVLEQSRLELKGMAQRARAGSAVEADRELVSRHSAVRTGHDEQAIDVVRSEPAQGLGGLDRRADVAAAG